MPPKESHGDHVRVRTSTITRDSRPTAAYDRRVSAPELKIEERPSAEDLAKLDHGLSDHAVPFTDHPGFQPLAVMARDGDGNLVGGVVGKINWTWLYVSKLWVIGDARSTGLGSRLMGALEEAAAARGCRWAHLDTFSFQAPSFYERLGYESFATLPDYPPGHRRIFMRKSLVSAEG